MGGEDPLEEEMTTHSSILAWKTPWTEEPGGLQSMGSQRIEHDRLSMHMSMQAYTHTHTHTHICNNLLIYTQAPQALSDEAHLLLWGSDGTDSSDSSPEDW